MNHALRNSRHRVKSHGRRGKRRIRPFKYSLPAGSVSRTYSRASRSELWRRLSDSHRRRPVLTDLCRLCDNGSLRRDETLFGRLSFTIAHFRSPYRRRFVVGNPSTGVSNITQNSSFFADTVPNFSSNVGPIVSYSSKSYHCTTSTSLSRSHRLRRVVIFHFRRAANSEILLNCSNKQSDCDSHIFILQSKTLSICLSALSTSIVF